MSKYQEGKRLQAEATKHANKKKGWFGGGGPDWLNAAPKFEQAAQAFAAALEADPGYALALVNQALLLYERAVLNALEEVETAMTTFVEQRVRVEAVERAATAARRALSMATGLYKDGLIGFQEVLDSQRQLFRQESAVATSRSQAAQSLVLLYRALGGGWDPSEVEQPAVSSGS